MARSLKGTKSHGNLKTAFAGESQANRRYLYFARVADIEGYPDMGGLFRDTSEAETGHAFGHLDFLKEVGDPVTDVADASAGHSVPARAVVAPAGVTAAAVVTTSARGA